MMANNITQPYFEDATLLECEAFNSSFSATFTYRDGAQDINMVRHKQVVETPFVPVDCFWGPLSPSNGGNPGEATAEKNNRSCSTMNLSGQRCDFNAEIIRTLAYQAVIDSFNRLMQGTVGYKPSLSGSSEVVANTSLFDTLLLNTKELAFLKVPHSSPDFPSLPIIYSGSAGEEYSGLFKTPRLSYNNSLAEALEQLFQNITLSLLSENLLLYVRLNLVDVDLRLTIKNLDQIRARILLLQQRLMSVHSRITIFTSTHNQHYGYLMGSQSHLALWRWALASLRSF